MNIYGQVINTVIPLTICVLGILPFLFIPSLREKDEKIDKTIYHSAFCYLLLLGFGVIALIIIETMSVMISKSSPFSIFICSILSVACIDKIIDLSPKMIFIKANLLKRLLYFVILLSAIPIVWQILVNIIPKAIIENFRFMGGIEIVLMLIMFALGIVNHPVKKKEQTDNGWASN